MKKEDKLTDAYGFLKSLGIDGFDEKAVYLLHLADRRSMNRMYRTVTGGRLPIVEEIGPEIKNAPVDAKCPYGNLSESDQMFIAEICDIYADFTVDQLLDVIGVPSRTLEAFFSGHENRDLILEDIHENECLEAMFRAFDDLHPLPK